MAISNHERVGKALELLKVGIGSHAERELTNTYGDGAADVAQRYVSDDRLNSDKPVTEWDVSPLLRMIWDQWNDVFRNTLGQAERSLVSEIREARNRWAHQGAFSSDDADRALDSIARLLTAVSANQADEVNKIKMELRRVVFDEQMRSEKRRSAGAVIESQVTGTLKPWREVINPHRDVASGRYQQAEFAADLWQVHIGEGSDEYRKPEEFFRRTYLTESLSRLLADGIRRITGDGGDPVVQLQTNFGGGKTHSMLALYHLLSGTPAKEMVGIDSILRDVNPKVTGAASFTAKRVVLVGNKISPGNPSVKADGTVVRTLWGELAYQLGGKPAFERIRADDENATSPGDALRELFNSYGPCLILIDEWVAYARQLHDAADLPGGSFETHFTFAQALTESAKLAKNCLLVISLPASDTIGSPHTRANDEEVGGERGRAALDRLRNAVGRVEASWRPATAEEGFEIVRRRLFEPLIENDQFVARDTVARAFYDLYQTQHQEFPPECRDSDYEKRLRAAYPIHPEVFDRLYNDWSTLIKFQRTRGVLRLMASVIHSLWEKGDRNPLIMPSNIPIDDQRVQHELTRYLSDNWVPVIQKDVDGPNALPLRLDGDVPNLGKYAAARRVARTVYLGSAPTSNAANRGIEDRRIKLGCVMPGESPSIFGDALRRLSAMATYLYQDGSRYWYSTQPTVTKLADDRADEYRRNPDAVTAELERRLKADLKTPGDFSRVHPLPQSGQDVADDTDARLVVLSPDHPFSKEPGSSAEVAAREILQSRGNSPRIYQNALIFLAPDLTRFQDLDEAVRRYLAWTSILEEKTLLNLDPHQVRQAETQKTAADGAVTARLPETYLWLLVPEQKQPGQPIAWKTSRLTGQEALAVRASRKVRSEEDLITGYAASRLRMDLDKIPLWRGDHVAVKQLVEDFARYPYLSRLRNSEVLLGAVRAGVGLLTMQQDSFAYADSFDEVTGRYRGLRIFEALDFNADVSTGLLVKPEVALKQSEAERPPTPAPSPTGTGSGTGPDSGTGSGPGFTYPQGGQPGDSAPTPPAPKVGPKRYHGTVTLDPMRVGRDAGQIADELISHLSGLVNAKVTVTLEIDALIPTGAPDNVVRTVTENGRTLKFKTHGFEEE